jgi:hypothetical protein
MFLKRVLGLVASLLLGAAVLGSNGAAASTAEASNAAPIVIDACQNEWCES